MKPLTLPEEVLLLALRDEKGTTHSGVYRGMALGAAVLSELLLQKRIRGAGRFFVLLDRFDRNRLWRRLIFLSGSFRQFTFLTSYKLLIFRHSNKIGWMLHQRNFTLHRVDSRKIYLTLPPQIRLPIG